MSRNVPSPEGSEDLNPIVDSCQVRTLHNFAMWVPGSVSYVPVCTVFISNSVLFYVLIHITMSHTLG
jgi:hypothetical protein